MRLDFRRAVESPRGAAGPARELSVSRGARGERDALEGERELADRAGAGAPERLPGPLEGEAPALPECFGRSHGAVL